MNKTLLILTLLATATLAGCTSDETPETQTETPMVSSAASYANPQPASVTGMEFVAQLMDNGTAFPSASGIWTYGDYVFGSGLGAGFFIADVSDPAEPELLYREPAENATTPFSRDADVVAHPDGTLSLVLATQSNGMHVWDVSDPRHPSPQSIVDVPSNHNIAAVPGTELVFNSRSGGAGSTNDLVDLSDPFNPVVLGTFGDHGCHDISFFGRQGEQKFRAYCAGIEETQIWSLDHLAPAAPDFGIHVLGTVAFGQQSPIVGNPALSSYPIRTLHHLAVVNEDASVLIIGDEQNGGGSPGACYFYDETTGLSTPFGALWFYDLSDETAPTLQGWLSPPTVTPSTNVPDPTTIDPTTLDPTRVPRLATDNVPNCTAHFGTFVPGEDKLVMSWYSAGVLLVDFSDIQNPTILDQYQPDPTNPWDARIHNGYVFTGDIVRGMDVLKLV